MCGFVEGGQVVVVDVIYVVLFVLNQICVCDGVVLMMFEQVQVGGSDSEVLLGVYD